MMKPILSLIIPCYNVQDYVQPALQSIVDNLAPEHYPKIELLIVNDGATDQTPERIQQFADAHLQSIPHRIIHQDNAGLSSARNTGMAQAKGEYWLFLDSDDIFVNHALDKILACIEQQQPDIIEFDACKFHDNDWATKSLYAQYFQDVVNMDFPAHRLHAFEENRWYVWSRCYHRKLFDNQLFEVGKLFEDMMTVPYAYLMANHIAVLPETFIGYRQRPASILATLSHRHLRDLYYGVEKAMSAERDYPHFLNELSVLQYKNWRMIVAESIKKFIKTKDLSYLTAVQDYRAQMRQHFQRDYGWQFGYFGRVLIQKILKK